MMVIEIGEDRIYKAMKAVDKILEHADCLSLIFEDIKVDEYGNRDEHSYHSRYGMRTYRK